MSIRWWWWTLGAVGCILLGTIWASLSNPAVLPGLRGAVLNFGEWVETHPGALTLLATLFIAAFTGTLWWSTRRLWKAGEQQIALAKQTSQATQIVLGQTRVIERAYVKLSHEPPGVRFERMDMTIHIKLRVKNFGRTPAYVTDVILNAGYSRAGGTITPGHIVSRHRGISRYEGLPRGRGQNVHARCVSAFRTRI